nr:uncharacterized protein LOC107279099 [Oryza sativa Japonica Group]
MSGDQADGVRKELSRGEHRRRVPAGVQWRCRHCTISGRLLFIAGTTIDVAVSFVDVAASPSAPACPRIRRNAVVHAAPPSVTSVPTPAAPSAVPGRQPTSPSPPSASQRQGRPWPRLPSTRTLPVFVVVVSVRRRHPLLRSAVSPCRLIVSLCRHRRRHRSGVFHAVLASGQLLPAALVASSLAPAVIVLPSFPVIVAFVPPSSRSRSPPVVRQASRCSPIVVFVLGSTSSSLVLAASCLRPRIAAEVVRLRCPRAVSAAPVRRRRAAPFRVVGCSFAYVLRVASVVPEVPEAWFAVIAEGSEGRSL